MLNRAISYLDAEFLKDYEELLQQKANDPKFDLTKDHISQQPIHYMYMRSYFDTIPFTGKK